MSAGPQDDDKFRDGLPRSIRVLVVASVRLYREGMAASLGCREGIVVVGTAMNRSQALEFVARERPDVMVLDIATEHSLELIGALKASACDVKVVAFGVEEHDREILACAEAGADGFVGCDGSMDDLSLTIAGATRGELLCSPRVAGSLFRRVGTLAHDAGRPLAISALTRREHEILRLIDAGLSNKEIAVRLHIEVATVKNHVHHLLEKLQVTSRAEAAARLGMRTSIARGWLGLPSSPSRAT